MLGLPSKLVFLAFLRSVFLPVVALVSFALISFGVSLLCYPAGWITGGVLLFLAVLDARRP